MPDHATTQRAIPPDDLELLRDMLEQAAEKGAISHKQLGHATLAARRIKARRWPDLRLATFRIGVDGPENAA